MALTHLVELVKKLRRASQDNPHTQVLANDVANDIETAILKADDNIVWGSGNDPGDETPETEPKA